MLSLRLVLATLLCLPLALAAQTPAPSADPWMLRLRAGLSGSSPDEGTDHYRIYSGIGLEGAVERCLGHALAVELAFRTESREVVGPATLPGDNRLGSLDMLPVTLLAHWRPTWLGNIYLSAGGALTFTYEKSGSLDSSDVPPSLNPAVGFGGDLPLSQRLVLNLDFKWNPLTARIEKMGQPEPKVKIDPATLGLGLGVRF